MVVFEIFNGLLKGEKFRLIAGLRSSADGRVPRTGYHLVDPSPWPIMVRAGIINEAASFIRFVHNGSYTLVNFICATWLLLSSFYS